MLQRLTWNPDYDAEKRRRMNLLLHLRAMSHKKRKKCINLYARGAEGCIAFIEDWCETFDPRNAGTSKPTRMPFKLFPKQVELVHFLWACYQADANGLIEKSRDMGATWVCVCFSVWLFLFHEGATVGWGSRKAMLVDKIGDMNSIFEKIRFLLLCLPTFLYPAGFDPSSMMSEMKIREPGSNAIVGEAGDDIGRGGRTRIFFKDESAHYEHPEMIEASLGDTTRVQIDISSVNGLGNVFHRRREGGTEWSYGKPAIRGKTNVFVMDWSDHPLKTPEWHEERRLQAIDDGLLHVFEQEVNRNYAASISGVIIPAAWVVSAIDAHVKLNLDTGRGWFGGLDVADDTPDSSSKAASSHGKSSASNDKNAFVAREGILVKHAEDWGGLDTGETTRRAIGIVCDIVPSTKGRREIRVQYDCIGVGSGVKAESNRLSGDEMPEDQRMPEGIVFNAWNAGAKCRDPEAKIEDTQDGEVPTNEEFFQNMKAQAWWAARRRFEKTHRAVTEGIKYPTDELISIPSTLPNLRTLQKELSQPTGKKSATMKMMVDKKPPGTRSPNLGDAFIMCYFPVESSDYDQSLGWL